MEIEAGESPFLFVGNRLCLDFLNTEVISQGQRVSLIRTYADFKAWLLAARAIEAASIERWEAAWSAEEKERVVIHALELRTTLRGMAEQITAGQAVSDRVIAIINGWLAQRKGYPVLQRTENGYALTMCYEEGVGSLLAPLAESAAALLAHADLKRVRKCENPTCILYFYDTSKNHARRWCSMDLCGNRIKVAAHYRRSRRTAAENATGISRAPGEQNG